MYRYNSTHKIITALIVMTWAIYQFSGRNNDTPTYANGQEKRIGAQENNLNQGKWTWFHANGKIRLTGNFDKGERVGTWKSYDSLGNLTLESTYTSNKLNGLFTQYDQNGKVIYQCIYQEDTIQKKARELIHELFNLIPNLPAYFALFS